MGSTKRRWGEGEELARLALSELLSHHRFELQEQFQRNDIRWALGLKAGERCQSSPSSSPHLRYDVKKP